MEPIKFKRESDKIWVAFFERENSSGVTVFCAVRVIKEDVNHYRADHTAAVWGSWMPWEAINGTRYYSLAGAKQAARRFVQNLEGRGV